MSGSPSGDEVSKRESTTLKLPADIGSTFGGRLLRTTAGLREPDAQKCLWMRPCNESIQLQVRAYCLSLRASRIRPRPAQFCLRRVQRGFGRLRQRVILQKHHLRFRFLRTGKEGGRDRSFQRTGAGSTKVFDPGGVRRHARRTPRGRRHRRTGRVALVLTKRQIVFA